MCDCGTAAEQPPLATWPSLPFPPTPELFGKIISPAAPHPGASCRELPHEKQFDCKPGSVAVVLIWGTELTLLLVFSVHSQPIPAAVLSASWLPAVET